jgi:hypothetical protein
LTCSYGDFTVPGGCGYVVLLSTAEGVLVT